MKKDIFGEKKNPEIIYIARRIYHWWMCRSQMIVWDILYHIYICREKKSKCKVSFLLLFIDSWSIYLCRKNALFNVRSESCDISRDEILILCVTLELQKKTHTVLQILNFFNTWNFQVLLFLKTALETGKRIPLLTRSVAKKSADLHIS